MGGRNRGWIESGGFEWQRKRTMLFALEGEVAVGGLCVWVYVATVLISEFYIQNEECNVINFSHFFLVNRIYLCS